MRVNQNKDNFEQTVIYYIHSNFLFVRSSLNCTPDCDTFLEFVVHNHISLREVFGEPFDMLTPFYNRFLLTLN